MDDIGWHWMVLDNKNHYFMLSNLSIFVAVVKSQVSKSNLDMLLVTLGPTMVKGKGFPILEQTKFKFKLFC